MKVIQGGITSVVGIRAAGVYAGIKKESHKEATKDIALIVADSVSPIDQPIAAGVYTKNRVCAAPVLLCKEHLQQPTTRAIVINSGNANACTGDQGMHNAKQMAQVVANKLSISVDEVLVCSTGVIGQQLPMEKVETGIISAAEHLSNNGGNDVAVAIMTTDTVSKSVSVEIEIDNQTVRIGGTAKGSGMIAPNMATMLGFITTDVAITPELLQSSLSEANEISFNCITVDTDTSTNDTVLVLATGAANHAKIESAIDPNYEVFCKGLTYVCTELAKMIARDGEGATKLVEILIENAQTKSDAIKAGRAVAESPLVKTAIFANDANWGRFMMAIGKSGAIFDPYQVDIFVDDYQIVRNGMNAGYKEETASEHLNSDTIQIRIDLRAGIRTATFWSCDYSYDYIRINADYRT